MTTYPIYGGLGLGIPQRVKRRVFVSYHHGADQPFYDLFSRSFGDTYDMVYDNSLERKVDSDNVEYVMRKIREEYLTGTSCTVLLVGANTWGRKYVDWEIAATLDKQHGLLGLQLPTLPVFNNTVHMPHRLWDNVQSGYAVWMKWDYLMSSPGLLSTWVEQATAKDKSLIRDSRERRLRNA